MELVMTIMMHLSGVLGLSIGIRDTLKDELGRG